MDLIISDSIVFGEKLSRTNPAYKLFMKIGMVNEGRLKERYFKNGVYVNTHIISILAKEARKKPWWN